MNTKSIIKTIDNNTLYFEAIQDESGYFLDTKVTINGTLFCWITWNDVTKFTDDFSAFMAKYRI